MLFIRSDSESPPFSFQIDHRPTSPEYKRQRYMLYRIATCWETYLGLAMTQRRFVLNTKSQVTAKMSWVSPSSNHPVVCKVTQLVELWAKPIPQLLLCKRPIRKQVQRCAEHQVRLLKSVRSPRNHPTATLKLQRFHRGQSSHSSASPPYKL